jgi:hypothetical protein
MFLPGRDPRLDAEPEPAASVVGSRHLEDRISRLEQPRLAGFVAAGAAVALVTGAALALPSATAGPAAPAASSTPEPPLALVAAAKSLTLDRDGTGVNLDLGMHILAGSKPFELRVTRKSYNHPVVATQIVNGKPKVLPKGLVKDFAGLPGFFQVAVTNAAGRKVLNSAETFCPNSLGRVRSRPTAPVRSPYPGECSTQPFTLGSVAGIQAGWSVPIYNWERPPVNLPVGKYTARVTVAKVYRELFGIPANRSTATVQVTVRNAPSGGGHDVRTQRRAAVEASAPRPNAQRPVGPAKVPAGPKPDLRSLPAFAIGIKKGERGTPAAGKEFLQFAANVWNAGPSTLVLDGFRKPGASYMDAYQYFYDTKGKQIGFARTGTMEWDARDGHNHWHFTDFASYRLLNAKQTLIVRSQKEAFCLAATDQIDQTVKNANWHPTNTDLHTACGSQGSLAVREVLDVGAGDTYVQSLPGQSFDITSLPNGTYYIQVIANPDKRLFESNTKNNVALRKVILGGTRGARTVTVPAHGLVNAP